ncbi:MAG: DNA topoisomerase 4 subunit A [Phycisphaeraceae bacterium]|nr:DNA topoisomerase 4 subunit A [Phycisphaeraceae bacterium]
MHIAAQERYLNYALSVITSRALPDVRDGLKPVQRRILYTMWLERLYATAKHRKCAGVVGSAMRDFHPHGDQAIYDALVRLAQPFSVRLPLIEGSGNFGSLDGDPAAAMRYTECRLAPLSHELLEEIGQDTVPFRPNYDGTRSEPVVLPARAPNLLINGSTGIAVGMATNIPPHNAGEVCAALLKLIDDPEIKPYQLVANDAVQGPDFPTGGQILNTREELREIYKTGSGAIRLRATWEKGPVTRGGKSLFVNSIPYNANKSTIVEQIAAVVLSRKMPLLMDVRDLSSEDVRIELLLKKDADDQKVMAYLFKHTGLQSNFNVNLTCLIPTENPAVGRPEQCDLKTILWHFLHFRLEVVTRRLQNELAQLEKRLHVLEGFALVFDVLDEIIRIIRRSDGKADAADKIMNRFPPDKKGKGGLDAEQTDAILELKLYRLAKLEINLIQEELKDKQKRAREIRKLLDEQDAAGRWKLVRSEIEQVRDQYGPPPEGKPEGKRRTIIESAADEPVYTAEDFIVAEDNFVLVSRDGWIKRQKEIADPSKTRMREGDAVLACEAGSTRATIAFFSSFGTCYTARIIDVPASSGYGEPIQKMFRLKDGERIVAALSLDSRAIGDITEDPKKPDLCPATHAFAAGSDGYALRFGLQQFVEPSTRAGRRYARPRPRNGSQMVGVEKIHGDEIILAVSEQCRAMVCRADEINYLSGPGMGVQLIKLSKDDRLIGFKASGGDRDLLKVETNRGAEKTISTAKYKVTSRGGRGWEIQKNGRIARVLADDVPAPILLEE